MKKKIKKVLLWTLSLFLLLLIAFSSILYFNKEKIQTAILQSLKENLVVPLEIGEAEISLSKFPKASLKFNDIFSPGLKNNISDTLIAAEEVYFLFDLWEIIKGKLIVDQIDIEKANIHIVQLKNDYNNFTIWKKSSSSENQLFTLSQIQLSDVNFQLFDQRQNLNIKLDIKNNGLSGNFSQSIIDINSKGKFVVQEFTNKDFSLAKPIELEAKFSVNTKDKQGLLFTGQTNLLNSNFNFEGQNKKEQLSLAIYCQDLELQKVESFLRDQKFIEHLDWRFSGLAICEFNYLSKLAKKPTYQLKFNSKDSKLSNSKGLEISKLNLKADYSQNEKFDLLKIESFSGQTSDGELNGNLSIKNFNNPFLKLNLNSTISLEEWLLLNPTDTISKASGKVKIVLDLENQFKSFDKISSRDLKNIKTNGSISLEDCEIQFKSWDGQIEKLNGDLVFKDQLVDIERLFFKFKNSDVYLDGSFANVVNYIALENQKLKVNCKLTSQNIQLEDFIASESKGNDTYDLNFADNIGLDLDVNIQKFAMRKFSAKRIKGNLKIENAQIIIDKLQLDADEGHYDGNLTISTRNKDQYSINANLDFNRINMHQLFESFENFGQSAIVSNNIFGKANGQVNFKAFMDSQLSIIPNSIVLESDIQLSDGHIKDYEPMLALSKFSDIEDLKDVYFHSLKNHISIKNSVITIPVMNIESNIMNLQISGTHGFDNIVDYRVKLKASDALFNKRKKNTKPTEFDEHLLLNERKDDHFIFIKMFGPLEKIKIELDNKSIGKSINQDLINQKDQLKNIFKKEKSDKKTDDPGIIYDWEDEDDG